MLSSTRNWRLQEKGKAIKRLPQRKKKRTRKQLTGAADKFMNFIDSKGNKMKCALALLIALGATLLVALYPRSDNQVMMQADNANGDAEHNLNALEWWKKSNFYHIYVRSFKDSNGDGNGDLRGIIEKLDYLQSINVQTILMGPFYSSPMADGGYDIDDYMAINPMFGTMQDFEQLVEQVHKRHMKIVVDFVPNHSSDQHKWFKCSERALIEPERCGRYKDYYVWTNSTRYQGRLPSNWISVFGGGPAWQWSELRREFYLHQFMPQQPDLNWRNQAVRDEFKEITRFWLRKGADGIRVDSIIYLIEDTINYPDEPANPDWHVGEDPADRLDHIYTRCQPESVEIMRDWRQVAQGSEFSPKTNPRVIITEAYAAIPKLIDYYGKPDDRFADMPFNFELLKLRERTLSASRVEQLALSWIRPTRALKWPDEGGAMAPWIIWVVGNHDNKRMANQLGAKNVAAIHWLTYMLPGSPVNYYGDELPMHDSNYNQIPQKTIQEGEESRLTCRAPMAWSREEPAAGFSNVSAASELWVPLNTDWRINNVATLMADTSRPLNNLQIHMRLEHLRSKHLRLFMFGDLVFFRTKPDELDSVLALARTHETLGNILMLVNFDSQNQAIVSLKENQSELRHVLQRPPLRGKVVLAKPETDSIKEGALVKIERLVLEPSQAVLIEY